MNPDLMALMEAIGKVESGGNYGALGPKVRNGDRAYGKYQVMGRNVPEWTQNALGQALTPDEFLQNTDAQDKVAAHYLGASLDKYGNPADAASVHFTGRPLSQGADSSDGYLKGSEYVNKVLAAMGQGPATPMQAALEGDGDQLPAGARPTGYEGGQGPSTVLGKLFGADDSTIGNIGDAISGVGAGLVTASNPMAGAYMMAQLNAAKKADHTEFGVIGEDMFGGKKYGWINKNKQTVTAANASGAGSTGSGGEVESQIGRIADIRANGGSKEEALSQVDPAMRNYVRALVDGKALPQNMARGAIRSKLMAVARAVDPSLDENTYALRTQFAKNMAMSSPQSWGGQVNSAGTILNHLDNAYKNLDVLAKGPLGVSDTLNAANPARNWVRGQTGDKEFLDAKSRYDAAAKGIGDELEKILAGQQGAEASKRYWLERLDISRGPTAAAGTLDEARRLMMGRLDTIARQKETAYGTPTTAEDLLSPEAKKAIQRVSGGRFTYQGGGDQPQQGGAPSAPQAPSPSRTINGKTYHLINGKWFME